MAAGPTRLIGALAGLLLAAGPPAAHACEPPYSPDSPWNTPIGAAPEVGLIGDELGLEGQRDRKLTSDPTQYTYPVYYASAGTPRIPVPTWDWYSEVSGPRGTTLENVRRGVPSVPLPADADPASGYDAQIVVIDETDGTEWNLSEVRREGSEIQARNVGRYNLSWSGVPPRARDGDPWWLRGAGVPYLAGLVRPCEIAQGRIEHALAFAFDRVNARHIKPATKSDGLNRWSLWPNMDAPLGARHGLPEGTRLQLDPAISQQQMTEQWGCRGACLTIARALQEYGMYVIDYGGRPKVMVEYEGTARWNGTITADTVSPIPLTAFREVR